MPRQGLCFAGLLFCVAGAASAGRTADVLPAFPLGENRAATQSRALVVRGPVGLRSSGVAGAAAQQPPGPLPPPADSAHPIRRPPDPPPEFPTAVIDAAVDQATFQSIPRVTIPPAERSPEPISPADRPYAEAQPDGAPGGRPAPDDPQPEPDSPSDNAGSALEGSVKAAARLPMHGRRLDPRAAPPGADQPTGRRSSPVASLGRGAFDTQTVTTAGASLVLVLGLVLVLAWVWRRAAPRSSRALPDGVATVLGRVPLGGRQTAQMIKIGGKLVLVAVTPEGVEPITEVTDPAEVTRLLGLCEQAGAHSASAEFREVFEQIVREPAPPGFLGEEAGLIDRQKLADAYAGTPGGRAYG